MNRIALLVLFAFTLQQVKADDDSEIGCGVSNLATIPGDKGPHPVAPGNFPWYTAIYERPEGNEDNWTIICSGTLITPRSVLTAATCLYSKEPQDIKVTLGKLRLQWNHSEPNEIKKSVTEIRVHESYTNSSSPYAFNIGLLILDSDVPHHSFVCLVDNAENALQTPGFVVGWGLQEQVVDGRRDELSYCRVSVKERDAFVQTSRLETFSIPSDAHCNGTELIPHGTADVGTGLTFESGGHHLLYAVASRSNSLSSESEVATYTNVTHHYDWITVHME